MEINMEQQEKRLQDSLIKRFIGTLIIVGIVEYVLLMVADRFIMPFIAKMVFPEYEITESFSAIAIGLYLISALAGGLVGFVAGLVPAAARLPVSIALNNLLISKQNSFFITDGTEAIARMSILDKILFVLIMLLLLLVLLIPYIAGATYYSVTTVKEFKKIGAQRMQMRKDHEKRRNLMISDIAHDLRTPITTISGYAQALADGLVKEEDRQSYLEAIRAKSAGMNDLIQILFDYTKLDSEGFMLNKSREDICETVRECAAALYPDAEDKGMDIEVHIPEKKIYADIDKPQFMRVINNLMINAIRHNSEGKDIGLFVFEDAGRLYIAVSDKGIIIPADKAKHLYEPFFMGDDSRNSRNGSGLGLSVAKKITDMHGFSLKLEQGGSLKRYPLLKGYIKAFVVSFDITDKE